MEIEFLNRACPRQVLDALPGAVMLLDAAATIGYANPAMHALLGHAPGALLGRVLTELYAPAPHPDIVAIAQQRGAESTDIDSAVVTCVTLAGEPIALRLEFRPIVIQERWCVLCMAAPAPAASTRAFEHRQWQLRLFANLSSDYFYRASMSDQGHPVEIWPIERFTAITGYTREGVHAAGGWVKVIHPDDLPKIPNPARNLPPDTPQRVEYRIRTASGEIRWLRESVQVVKTPDTGTALIFGAVTDITVEHAAVAAMRESERHLRRIFDTVSQSFALLDTQLRVQAVNKKMLHDFHRGYGKSLKMGQSLLEQLPEEWQVPLAENARLALAGEPRREELLWVLPNGEEEWAAVQLNPIREGRRIAGLSMCVEGIHRRKVAEMALRESEAQLRDIFETVSQGFALLDTQLRLRAANKKFMQDFLLIFEPAPVIGDCLLDFVPPEYQEALKLRAACVMAGERQAEEILFSLFDREPEWNEVQLNPIFEDGRVVGMSMCIEEIHRRKVAELALRQSETQLRRIFETVSSGFALLDCNLRVEAANRQFFQEFAAIFGYEMAIGDMWPDPLPAAWREDFLEDARIALTGKYRHREYHYPESLTGSEWFSVELNPIVEDGAVVGLSICANDLEHRKRAEEELKEAYEALEVKVAARTRELEEANAQLRESEARFRLIAERASDVIWHVDGMNRVLYMSPAFERVFGWPIETLVEEGIGIAFRPEKRVEMTAALDAHLQHWRARKQAPPTFTIEVEYCHRDGHPFFAEVNMDFDFPNLERWNELGLDEDYPHILGVSRDLTERKRQEAERLQLEQQVLHAQKLESLGVMAGGIAHDFNNLLVGIMGYASLASMDLPDDHPVQTYIQHVEGASQRAADLTQQMLAYSGRGQFIVQPVDLSSLTQEMAHLLATVVSKKALVEYELAPDLPAVMADATQMRQIIMNLITNASESLEENAGNITLTTGACRLTARELSRLQSAEEASPGAFAFIQVADTGCGMTADTVRRIFEPFYTTKFTGRGLGLGAVHGIVRGHRGAIQVSSAVGAGTTIRVFLPTTDSGMVQASGPEEQNETTGSGESILVVDDEFTVREFAKRALLLADYRVFTATNGREAIELMEEMEGRVDAILLDLTMPTMDGAEAMAILERRWPQVGIVLTSGHTEQHVATHMADGHSVPFLHKPYHPDSLRRMIRQAITQASERAVG